MAKKQKTKKQKILAESRKIKSLVEQEEISNSSAQVSPNDLPRTAEYVFKMNKAGRTTSVKSSISKTHDYTHLKQDLIKTGILTTSIVVAQLVLFFILQ